MGNMFLTRLEMAPQRCDLFSSARERKQAPPDFAFHPKKCPGFEEVGLGIIMVVVALDGAYILKNEGRVCRCRRLFIIMMMILMQECGQ